LFNEWWNLRESGALLKEIKILSPLLVSQSKHLNANALTALAFFPRYVFEPRIAAAV